MDTDTINIEKLEELIAPHIGADQEIIDKKINYLTAPGDNYGSIMLKIDLTLKDKKSHHEDKLSMVAKIIPASEYFQEIFNIQDAFKNEIAFYDTIIPTLKEFKKKHGITDDSDLFPKLYGARINLNSQSDKVDKDGVILLENLKLEEYGTVNRYEGFDLETIKLILKNLAEFHAVPLAVKLQDPELFDKNIRPYCAYFYPRPDETPPASTMSILREKDHFPPEVLQKIHTSLENSMEFPQKFREPFSTIIHWDMWVNNIMVKSKNNVPVHTKFVDFQLFSYDTPIKDLLFFLITSVSLKLLKPHFDEFLELYHKYFIKNLLDLKCDVSKFSYEHFTEEIKATLEEEIGHILFMLFFIVLAKKDGVDPAKDEVWDNPATVPLEGKERAWWFVEECVKRKFL